MLTNVNKLELRLSQDSKYKFSPMDISLKQDLGEPSKLKMSQIVEKVHNFLDPPRIIWAILNLGKKLIFDE